MIRLSGTAADAAGAGQLQGSSGFGRRSLFRARRDGPDVPENPFGDVSDKRFRGMAGLSQIFSTFGGQNSTQ